MSIDIANRSLLSDLLPMQSLRAAGLHLIGAIGPLRRLAMREGLAPSWRRSCLKATRPLRKRQPPVWISHITLVSVTTDAKVPISTATEAGSIQVSFWRAITNTFSAGGSDAISTAVAAQGCANGPNSSIRPNAASGWIEKLRPR